MANEMMMNNANQLKTNAQTQALMQRASQEVQAAVFMAKQFPRDEDAAYNRIMSATMRRRLAEGAFYEYAKGGTNIFGPSIRLAEVIAQHWGNLETGVKEIERRDGESTAEAYAWDLETNTRVTKQFTVKHQRETKNGSYALTDSREIYELIANQGARRQRACILAVIPSYVVEDAIECCQKTLQADGTPLNKKIEDAVNKFAAIGVTVPMLEEYAQRAVSAFTEQTLNRLWGVYSSIHDGMSGPWDHFNKNAGQNNNSNVAPQNMPPENTAPPQTAENMQNGQIDINTL